MNQKDKRQNASRDLPSPFFTVFTPTYNRAHTLGQVYASLLAQTFRDFEWLIVDDGSVDGTAELVKTWQMDAPFPLRYLQQTNKGKHYAYNRGVREAHGELFLALDSDDTCVANTLERFNARWFAIPEGDRAGFSGITCLCCNADGAPIDGELASDTLDGHPFDVMHQHRRHGEMWGFHRTEILREFPFPEYPGERFVPESLVWNRIGRIYKIRFINEALRCYMDSPDSLSSSSVRIRVNSPRGTRLYYNELSQLQVSANFKIRALVNYARFCFHGRVELKRMLRESAAPVAACILAPVGYLCYIADKRRSTGDTF